MHIVLLVYKPYMATHAGTYIAICKSSIASYRDKTL